MCQSPNENNSFGVKSTENNKRDEILAKRRNIFVIYLF